MSQPPKVLFIAHNHPELHPGGTEIFSHGLFRALRRDHGVEALFLACVNAVHRGRLPGTLLQSAGRASDELLLWTGHFDNFMLSQTDLHGVVPELERLLRSFEPDIVHFHHMLLIGVEALLLVRRVLPNAMIALTLHDYYPICANDGQLVTTGERRLCHKPSADACAGCFPETPRDRFVMRELFVKQCLSLVDRFVSPSEFLKRRYVEWGLPAERIDVIRNGLPEAAPIEHRPLAADGRRGRFAYFGHLNPFKGTLVAIEAARRLAQRVPAPISLALHGSASFQTDVFKAELQQALAAAPNVTAHGRYPRDEMPALMKEADWVIVPSIWWENAPLVIQEAFRHRRPVICSGIGGMAEAVRDGVDGLIFDALDAGALARAMDRLASEPGLLERLQAGIEAPRAFAAYVDELEAHYLGVRPGRVAAPVAPDELAVLWSGPAEPPPLPGRVQRLNAGAPLPHVAHVEVRSGSPADRRPAAAGRLVVIQPDRAEHPHADEVWTGDEPDAAPRLLALANRPPRAADPMRAAPWELDGDAELRVLATPAWRGEDRLAGLLAQWCAATRPGDPACLYLLADPAVDGAPEELERRVLEAVAAAGIDLEQAADVEVLMEPLTAERDARLHRAIALYVPLHRACAGHERLARATGGEVVVLDGDGLARRLALKPLRAPSITRA
jgi:glycosyltransferase involved in cell wall biosynthesis